MSIKIFSNRSQSLRSVFQLKNRNVLKRIVEAMSRGNFRIYLNQLWSAAKNSVASNLPDFET